MQLMFDDLKPEKNAMKRNTTKLSHVFVGATNGWNLAHEIHVIEKQEVHQPQNFQFFGYGTTREIRVKNR